MSTYEDRFENDPYNKDDRQKGNWFTNQGMLAKTLEILGVLVAAISLVVHIFVLPSIVASNGNQLQNQLMADYALDAAALHNCKTRSAGAANVAKSETDALNTILNNAIGGKYGDVKAGTFDSNQVTVAMRGLYPVSLYPDTKALSVTFDKVLAVVTGCQSNFLGTQNTVFDDVRKVRDFGNGSWLNRHYGGSDYPTNALVVDLPGVPRVTGKAALDMMATPIIDTQTASAFGTGLDDSSLNGPFGNTPTVPSTR